MHWQRGEKFAPPTPVAQRIHRGHLGPHPGPPGILVSIVDSIKSVMSRVFCVSDLGQGTNSVRKVSKRALPDQLHEKAQSCEGWIDQGTNVLNEARQKAMATLKNPLVTISCVSAWYTFHPLVVC